MAKRMKSGRYEQGRANEIWDDFRYIVVVARVGTLSRAADQFRTDHTTAAREIQPWHPRCIVRYTFERSFSRRRFMRSTISAESIAIRVSQLGNVAASSSFLR